RVSARLSPQGTSARRQETADERDECDTDQHGEQEREEAVMADEEPRDDHCGDADADRRQQAHRIAPWMKEATKSADDQSGHDESDDPHARGSTAHSARANHPVRASPGAPASSTRTPRP